MTAASGSARQGNGLRPVSILGVGSTPFGRLEGQDITKLAVDACREAISDSGVARSRIEALYLGNFAGERLAGQGSLAAVVARAFGT